MTFSIITVSRNNATTIARTIASLQTQQIIGVQQIFVDGASTDGTQAAISAAARPGDVVITEPDHGIYDAMNKGLRLATGDIIGILNADDHYKDITVLARVAAAFENSALQCVYGNVEFFDRRNPDRVTRRYNSGNFNPSRLALGLMPAHPATFYRRQVYERLGGFKTDYAIAADFEFTVRAFWKTGLAAQYMPETLVRMQQGGASSSGLRSKWVLNREILRALRDNGVHSSPLHLAAKIPLRLLELR